MSVATTASYAVHMLTGAVWVGAIVFLAAGGLPLARDGSLGPAALGSLAGTLRTVSRVAAVLLLATGLHLGAVRYGLDGLNTPNGHLVLTMAGLWFLTTGLVEAGTGTLVDGTDRDKVREPARDATRLLQAAAVGGSAILVVAALLLGQYVGAA